MLFFVETILFLQGPTFREADRDAMPHPRPEAFQGHAEIFQAPDLMEGPVHLPKGPSHLMEGASHLPKDARVEIFQARDPRFVQTVVISATAGASGPAHV